jgi:PAS domain S-box-containing protein
MSEIPLRLLVIEDSDQDFSLLQRYLQKEKLLVFVKRVLSLNEITESLNERWDLILSDYNLIGFTAVEALQMIRQRSTSVPVIIISSAVSDETAVELMRGGAADFIRKDNLSRLGPAMQREIAAAKQKERDNFEVEKWEYVFQNAQWGMSLATPDNHFISVNKAFAEMHGSDVADWIGRPLSDMFDEESRSRFPDIVKKSHADGHVEYESMHVRKDSSVFPVLTRVTVFKDQEGKIFFRAANFQDITAQKMDEENLKRAKANAEEASLAKTRFLANMSHEIRTPLGLIMGFTELALDQKAGSDDLMVFLKTIQRNGQLLSELIGEVLDLAKIESKKIEIENVQFSVKDLVNETVGNFKNQAVEKGIALKLTLSQSLPALIVTDVTKLRQILVNLISNAVKFTPSGEVVVLVDYFKKTLPNSSDKIKFTIRDTGIGISAEQRKNLFRAFSQGDSSMTRKYGGSGLGLTLSRELAQALGGEVDILNSEPNCGTTFVCEIKVLEDTQKMPIELQKKMESLDIHFARLDDVRVLLIDDSKDNQALFTSYLTKSGALVDLAENGLDGVKKALKSDYDILLMDIQMPIMNGHEATIELRKKGYIRPIIALTAHAFREERELAFKEGFDDYVTKPVNRTTLIESICRNLTN